MKEPAMDFRNELIELIDKRISSLSERQFRQIIDYKISHQNFLRRLSVQLYPVPENWVLLDSETAQNYQIVPENDILFTRHSPDVTFQFEDDLVLTNGRLEICEFTRRLAGAGQSFWQAPIYSFTSLPIVNSDAQSPTIDVTCHLKTYYDYLITGEYMAFELAAAVLDMGMRPDDIKAETIDTLRKKLPVRRMLHENPRWTHIKCGAVMPLAIKTADRKYLMPLMKRSSRVSESQGLWQTIPAGSFQPEHPDDLYHDEDYNLLNCVLKETAEELFGYTTPERIRQSSMNEIHYLPPIRSIRKLLESGGAEFIVTGIGIEALTNRVDLTALLNIHDAGWYEKFGKQMRVGEEGSDMILIEPRLDSLPEHITPDTLSAMSELAILRAEKYFSL